MSLKFLHQVIIFAGFTISLVFGAWCFFSPDNAGDPVYMAVGVVCLLIAAGFIAYEVHFLKRTRRLIIH